MIDKETVLILGAGASYPYGYPLGSELRTKILQVANLQPEQFENVNQLSQVPHRKRPNINLSNDEVNGLIEYLVLNKGFNHNDIIRFYTNFNGSSTPSIDTFLEHRKGFLQIGKIFIALSILKCEYLDLLFDNCIFRSC